MIPFSLCQLSCNEHILWSAAGGTERPGPLYSGLSPMANGRAGFGRLSPYVDRYDRCWLGIVQRRPDCLGAEGRIAGSWPNGRYRSTERLKTDTAMRPKRCACPASLASHASSRKQSFWSSYPDGWATCSHCRKPWSYLIRRSDFRRIRSSSIGMNGSMPNRRMCGSDGPCPICFPGQLERKRARSLLLSQV